MLRKYEYFPLADLDNDERAAFRKAFWDLSSALVDCLGEWSKDHPDLPENLADNVIYAVLLDRLANAITRDYGAIEYIKQRIESGQLTLEQEDSSPGQNTPEWQRRAIQNRWRLVADYRRYGSRMFPTLQDLTKRAQQDLDAAVGAAQKNA